MILLTFFDRAIRRAQKLNLDRAAWLLHLAARLRHLRRELLPTRDELDKQYLEAAADRYDLEMRIRELDRARKPGREVLRPDRMSI
jgi:hypothetical protein